MSFLRLRPDMMYLVTSGSSVWQSPDPHANDELHEFNGDDLVTVVCYYDDGWYLVTTRGHLGYCDHSIFLQELSP